MHNVIVDKVMKFYQSAKFYEGEISVKPVSTWSVSYCLNLVNAVYIDIELHQFCNVSCTYSDGGINDCQATCKFHSYLRVVFIPQQLLTGASTVPQGYIQEISKFCNIKKYRYRLRFDTKYIILLTFF